MVAIKEIIGRAWFYTRLGWGNYIAWWLGAVAYITIIYALALEPLRLLPAGIWTYLLIFVAMMLGSLFLGYFMKEIRIYGIEHKINTETNPYNYKVIRGKETLAYQSTIFQIGLQIESLKKQIEICKAVGVDPTSLEAYLPELEAYRTKFQELLENGMVE